MAPQDGGRYVRRDDARCSFRATITHMVIAHGVADMTAHQLAPNSRQPGWGSTVRFQLAAVGIYHIWRLAMCLYVSLQHICTSAAVVHRCQLLPGYKQRKGYHIPAAALCDAVSNQSKSTKVTGRRVALPARQQVALTADIANTSSSTTEVQRGPAGHD